MASPTCALAVATLQQGIGRQCAVLEVCQSFNDPITVRRHDDMLTMLMIFDVALQVVNASMSLQYWCT